MNIIVGSITVVAVQCKTCGSRLYPIDSLEIHEARHKETERTIKRWASNINLSRIDFDGGSYHNAEKRKAIPSATKGGGKRK